MAENNEEITTNSELDAEKTDKDAEFAELKSQLETEKEKVVSLEKKIQYLLADFDNLKKRSEIDVQNRVNSIVDDMILKFLAIYDDFIRAKDALLKQGANIQGLDAIVKNMDLFLADYGVKPIDCLGELFNPKLHEAISIKEDPSLEDNTVTAELRKGYILKDRIIRPSLVEISKIPTRETNNG